MLSFLFRVYGVSITFSANVDSEIKNITNFMDSQLKRILSLLMFNSLFSISRNMLLCSHTYHSCHTKEHSVFLTSSINTKQHNTVAIGLHDRIHVVKYLYIFVFLTCISGSMFGAVSVLEALAGFAGNVFFVFVYSKTVYLLPTLVFYIAAIFFVIISLVYM